MTRKWISFAPCWRSIFIIFLPVVALTIDVGNEKAVARFYRQVQLTQRLLVAAFERDEDWQPSVSKERQ